MQYCVSCIFLQLQRQNKVLVLVHNRKALNCLCTSQSMNNFVWDEFMLLNRHDFLNNEELQLTGKITFFLINTSQSKFSFQLAKQSYFNLVLLTT